MPQVDGTDDGAGFAVKGQSDKGVGVWGRAEPENIFRPGRPGGIRGGGVDLTLTPPRAGVSGESDTSPGVYGSSESFDAVVGETRSNVHAGVAGHSLTSSGIGVYGSGGQYAGYFEGAVHVHGDHYCTGQLTVNKDVLVTGDVILVNSSGDVAEDFDVADGSAHVEPGTVLVIGSNGKLCASTDPYDTRVAGVVSGAGELKPAIVLQRIESCRQRSPVALIGKAFCKVDALFGSITPGDLLTTSSTPGHAMKLLDHTRATGAILGKALGGLEDGQGLIPILVTPR
jgi:hypothetical protein